jgi:guanine deaminase
MSDHQKYIREAIRLSREHMQNGAGGPFGAVIVRDDKIIGRGWNKVTSAKDPTAHAEVVAIRDACKNIDDFTLAGSTIYTSCEPCPMCLAAVYWARIEKIYYGNSRGDAAAIQFDDEFLYREMSVEISKRAVPMTRLLPDEAIKVFQEWQAKGDKVGY